MQNLNFSVNESQEIYFDKFSEKIKMDLINAITKNPAWNSEQTDMIIQDNHIRLIQSHKDYDRDLITDGQFIDIIHNTISSHDLDPIQYSFRLTYQTDDDMDYTIYTYTLQTINP